MMINGPWQFSGLSDDAPDLEYGVAKVPKADDGDYASVLGGENVAICKGANVEASWKFLTWITSKEESAKICEAIGRYSPRADVDVQEMYKDDPLNATLPRFFLLQNPEVLHLYGQKSLKLSIQQNRKYFLVRKM